MATDLPEDTQLKRRARRRLIGAIALVLLAVIVLPMIFDAEKKPLDQDVSIQIPSQGDYVATAPKPAAVTPAPVQPAIPPADGKADAGKGDAGKGEAPKADAAKGDAPKADAAKAEAPKAALVKPEAAKTEAPKAEAPKTESPKAPAKAEAPKAAAKSDEQKAKEKADADRALALLNGAATAPKSEKAEKAAATGNFIVQVAAFSNEEKVQEARDKLSAAGVKTYAEKVSVKGGEVTRVRAGPYASRDAADAARGKIAGLGFGTATVVSR